MGGGQEVGVEIQVIVNRKGVRDFIHGGQVGVLVLGHGYDDTPNDRPAKGVCRALIYATIAANSTRRGVGRRGETRLGERSKMGGLDREVMQEYANIIGRHNRVFLIN